MPAWLLLAPAVVGLLVAVVVSVLRPREVPTLPRRLGIFAGVGLGVALAIELAALASGNWPFQTMGHSPPFGWLSSIPGESQFAAPLAAGLVAMVFQMTRVPTGPRTDVASLTPRTPFAFAPRGWLVGTSGLVLVAVVLAGTGGVASQPDGEGAYTMWMQDAGIGEIGTLIYGWAFSMPSLVLLMLLCAAALLALNLVARPPVAVDVSADLANRRSRSRSILATCSGALLLHVGAVLVFFAYTANLRTGIPLDDGVVPLYPPFAALAPILFVVGVGAATAGLAVWFHLFIEQVRVAAARQRVDSVHAN